MRSYITSKLKYIATSVLFLLSSALGSIAPLVATAPAGADPLGKVFVCKYVGTPGVNESLQTGQNPIDVSINAIKDYNGVGSYFNDQQGRSYVLAEDIGQPDPSVSQCPAGQGPTMIVLPTPTVNDACGLDNAVWNVPADTTSVTWSLVNGHLVATTTTGFEFNDGTVTHDFGLAIDSEALCPPVVTEVPVPAMPSVDDACGQNNAVWNVPADTTSVVWTLNNNGHLVASTTLGFEFEDGTTSHDFGVAPDSGVACVKKVFVCKYVGTPGVDERLQTGQNPISVSVNAIPEDPVVIGSFFADAQGRSFVLAFDEGQAEPDVSQCPARVTPGVVTFTDATCTAAGFFTIPETEGVVYEDGDENVLTAGNHSVLVGQTVTVNAFSTDETVDLTGTTTWSHTFSAATDCGHVLGETTTTPSTTGKVLADTGASVVLPTILAISMTLTAAGLMLGSYMQRKRATSDPTLLS